MNVAAHAGEMRVNIGGDPGWDEYGLPPVDIEIPDDARELDRDAQEYHRELRAQRWRTRTRLLQGPLGRDGMVLPLLAGCLALTLLAGTLLTVFNGGPLTSPVVVQAGHQLPDAVVLVDGQETPLREMRGLVLALIPPHCGCVHLRQLAAEAITAGVQLYLVGTHNVSVTTLAKQTGLATSHAVEDIDNALAGAYRPVTLTAVLVSADGSVTGVVHDHGAGFKLTGRLRMLIPSAQGLPHPGASGTASVAAGPAGG
jgi:hypothetical protein